MKYLKRLKGYKNFQYALTCLELEKSAERAIHFILTSLFWVKTFISDFIMLELGTVGWF